MRSLVTGSSGLLGGCVLSRLEAGDQDVRLLDIVAPAAKARHEFVRADLAKASLVQEAVQGVDVIYHLAAAQRMKPQFSAWSEQEIFERNLGSVRNILEAARREGVRKVVFVSSSGVYGIPQANSCTEDHPTVPLGAYGRSKLLAEELCLDAVKGGLDVTVLRPMSLFGPGMSGVFVMLFEWVRTGSPVYVLGQGQNRVQTVSAWDVADACVRASERPAARGAILNLGSSPDDVPPVIDTVRALVAHAGTGSRVIRIPAFALRQAARLLNLFNQSPIVPEHYILADRNFILAIDSARETLDWTPQYGNTQMMIDAYDWYVSAGEQVRPAVHPAVRLLQRLTPGRRGV